MSDESNSEQEIDTSTGADNASRETDDSSAQSKPPPAHPPLDTSRCANAEGDGENGTRHASADSHAARQVALNRRLVGATFVIAGATVIYMIFSGLQWQEIRSGGQDTRKVAEAAQRRANAASEQVNAMRGQLDTMNAQAKTLDESLKETRKSVNAAEKTANAAVTQANASLSQAATSKIATDAAQESARTTRQLYEAGQRPKIFFKWVRWREKPVANKKFDAEFVASNGGGAAYNLTTEVTVAVVPITFEGLLPYGSQGSLPHSPPNIEINEAPMEQGADQTFTTDFVLMLNETGAKLFEDDQVVIVFYGHLWWKDSLGPGTGLPFAALTTRRPTLISLFAARRGRYPKAHTPTNTRQANQIKTLPNRPGSVS